MMLRLCPYFDDVKNLKHQVLHEKNIKCTIGCSGRSQHNIGPHFSKNGLSYVSKKMEYFKMYHIKRVRSGIF